MLSLYEIFSAGQNQDKLIKFERFTNRLGIQLPQEYLNLLYHDKLDSISGTLTNFPEKLSISHFSNLFSIREIYYTYNKYIPYEFKHNTLPIAQDKNRNLVCFQRRKETILVYFEDSSNKIIPFNYSFKEFLNKLK